TLWATGIGAAIFVDGSLYYGAASSAGEWGHTSVALGGERCRCGAAGCLEVAIGAEALLRTWAQSDPSVELPARLDQPEWIERLTVGLGRLGDDAVALGASTLVLETLLAAGGRL